MLKFVEEGCLGAGEFYLVSLLVMLAVEVTIFAGNEQSGIPDLHPILATPDRFLSVRTENLKFRKIGVTGGRARRNSGYEDEQRQESEVTYIPMRNARVGILSFLHIAI